MKTGMKKVWPVLAVLAAAAVLVLTITTRPNENAAARQEMSLTEVERERYEQLQKRIDEGDGVGFARMLLEEDVTDPVYACLTGEDPAMVEAILTDALVYFGENLELDPIVRLRSRGFLSDNCFRSYWEKTGAAGPEEAPAGVDGLLVYELKSAWQRDAYALRSLRQMRSDGLVDDALHGALVEALGFDYMDDAQLENKQVDTVYTLTEQEKAAYDSVLNAIDQGDYNGVVGGMLSGEITMPVYRKLMELDGEILDDVMAVGLSALAEEGRFRDLVRLCVEGFVSDRCYEAYWNLTGTELPEASGGEEYLLHELEMIYRRNYNGTLLLQQIYSSGIISDVLHNKLVQRLGVDYMLEE